MKENVLDVLMYLFENYIDEDQIAEPDRANLESRLVEAGFGNTEVSKAFDWLESLATLEKMARTILLRLWVDSDEKNACFLEC